jgi:hypothetical protein
MLHAAGAQLKFIAQKMVEGRREVADSGAAVDLTSQDLVVFIFCAQIATGRALPDTSRKDPAVPRPFILFMDRVCDFSSHPTFAKSSYET